MWGGYCGGEEEARANVVPAFDLGIEACWKGLLPAVGVGGQGAWRESQQRAEGGSEVEAGGVGFAWLSWSQVSTCALLIKQFA